MLKGVSARNSKGQGNAPGAGWNKGVVSNAEASSGPGHGLDGEGREVALVDLEWESDEDEEASVDESEEDVDEGRSCGGRGFVYIMLREALGEVVFKSAVDMRRQVGCINEGFGSMSMGESRSSGVIWMSGSSSEKSSESVSYSASSEKGEAGASRSSSQRTQMRPL